MTYADLKSKLNQHNWDDGFELPEKILNNPKCDLALALEIFYLADGYAYLQNHAENTSQKEWKRFISDLYNDILSSKYAESGNKYEIPLTRVQKYKFRKQQVPEIFWMDL